MNRLLYLIDGIQGVLGICPCCGELFRLSEAKLHFPTLSAKKSPYGDYLKEARRVSMLDHKVTRAEARLESERERHEAKLYEMREKARILGRRRAKQQLKRIDPVFSQNGFDPQDVKVIFDPVEYIVFARLNSYKPVNGIHFFSVTPTTKRQETVMKHIRSVLRKGNVEFEVLHVSWDGRLA